MIMKIIIKDERVKFTKGRIALRCIAVLILLIAAALSYILPKLILRGVAADFYSEKIFPVLSFVPQAISGFYQFSVTELFVVIGIIMIIAMIIIFLKKLFELFFKTDLKHVLHYIYRVICFLLIIAVIGSLIFNFMHGINYNRTEVKKRLHLYGDERPYEDYEMTLRWAYLGMVNSRMQLGEDYNGVAHLKTNFETCVDDANRAVNTVSAYYDLGLSPNYIRAKPVFLSRLWSYTEITGFYDAFLGEANINTDYLDILHIPVTICHEIVHAKGYASETDANTIAVLSCINSPRADFRYAGYYHIFMQLYGTVGDYAAHEGVSMESFFSKEEFEPVRRDIIAYNMYRESFDDGPVANLIASFSEDVNNAFLESNGQQGGTDTYIVPANSYVEYFCRYILKE